MCRVLAVSRSQVRAAEAAAPNRPRPIPQAHLERIKAVIEKHPTYGYRRVWAILRYHDQQLINRKVVHRAFRLHRLGCHQRIVTPRPRARGLRSIATASNQRWAMDVTHIDCGRDGWAHLAVVIDCHDREIIGAEFAMRSRAREAERAVEEACIRRFGTLRPAGSTPLLRSDNGLIFQSRRFRAACRDYGLTQEFITPYTPEQNGVVERFFRSLKEECVYQHNFDSFVDARRAVLAWITWYNDQRPHQALGYKSPAQFRAQQLQLVA